MALCAVVKDCKNFKVRINAALALGSPSERSHYGDSRLFTFVWENLFIAFETSEDITDFAEFKYRNSLNSQVCGLRSCICQVLHCSFLYIDKLLRSFHVLHRFFMNV